MTHEDMTIADVLKDPLIRQMMMADRVSLSGMNNLLQDAARKQRNTKQSRHSLEMAAALVNSKTDCGFFLRSCLL